MFVNLKTSKKHHTEKGFTIIEMAIVIAIIGLFLAAAGQLYIQYDRYQKKNDTTLDMLAVSGAVTNFRNLYGRYPCPASLTANRENTQIYGMETACDDTSGPDFTLGAGVTAAGVAVVPGTKTPGERVRIGMIPFRALNLEEDQAYDGERNRFIYAISEKMAVSTTFTPDGGEISILNDAGGSLIEPPNSAHFMIMSAGENGAGAYNSRGSLNPCLTGSQESDNCNFTTDAIFRVAEKSNTGNGTATQFDDELIFASHKDLPLWETKSADSSDISMKPSGNVGVGVSASQNPAEELQVDGIIRAQDNPNTPVIEGQVQTNNICDYGSTTNNCFPPKLIGGELATGGGMKCPDNQFMTGIANGGPVCIPKKDIEVTCDGGTVLGINADGSLECGVPPKKCETQQVNICGENKTLFQSAEGKIITLKAGWTKNVEYKCQNESWSKINEWGECVCTTYTTQYNKDCRDWHGGCGTSFKGSQRIEASRACPSGQITEKVLYGECVCDPTSQTDYWACPDGFNKGRYSVTRNFICTGRNTGYCFINQSINDCSCAPESNTRNQTCSGGLSGQYQEKRDFKCPNGANKPGNWGSWYEVPGSKAQNCKCIESDIVSYKDCPDGFVGKIKITKTKKKPNCQENITVDESQCQPAPPVSCKWNMISDSGTTSSNGSGIRAGNSCTCGSSQTSCKRFLSAGQFAVGACACQ